MFNIALSSELERGKMIKLIRNGKILNLSPSSYIEHFARGGCNSIRGTDTTGCEINAGHRTLSGMNGLMSGQADIMSGRKMLHYRTSLYLVTNRFNTYKPTTLSSIFCTFKYGSAIVVKNVWQTGREKSKHPGHHVRR